MSEECGCNGEGEDEESPRVLSIQSHVVSGYVGNKCAVFPLQVSIFIKQKYFIKNDYIMIIIYHRHWDLR
jgi:hypothetical protein